MSFTSFISPDTNWSGLAFTWDGANNWFHADGTTIGVGATLTQTGVLDGLVYDSVFVVMEVIGLQAIVIGIVGQALATYYFDGGTGEDVVLLLRGSGTGLTGIQIDPLIPVPGGGFGAINIKNIWVNVGGGGVSPVNSVEFIGKSSRAMTFGATINPPLKIKVKDSMGNGLSGISVAFVLHPNLATGASMATVQTSPLDTDALGEVSLGGAANHFAGHYTVDMIVDQPGGGGTPDNLGGFSFTLGGDYAPLSLPPTGVAVTTGVVPPIVVTMDSLTTPFATALVDGTTTRPKFAAVANVIGIGNYPTPPCMITSRTDNRGTSDALFPSGNDNEYIAQAGYAVGDLFPTAPNNSIFAINPDFPGPGLCTPLGLFSAYYFDNEAFSVNGPPICLALNGPPGTGGTTIDLQGMSYHYWRKYNIPGQVMLTFAFVGGTDPRSVFGGSQNVAQTGISQLALIVDNFTSQAVKAFTFGGDPIQVRMPYNFTDTAGAYTNYSHGGVPIFLGQNIGEPLGYGCSGDANNLLLDWAATSAEIPAGGTGIFTHLGTFTVHLGTLPTAGAAGNLYALPSIVGDTRVITAVLHDDSVVTPVVFMEPIFFGVA